ncbi:MAG: tetratricopeptide repeat protein, partial [Nannocystaceae bacterium]
MSRAYHDRLRSLMLSLCLGSIVVACTTKPATQPGSETPEEDPLADLDLGDEKPPTKAKQEPVDLDDADAATKAEAKKLLEKNRGRDRDPEAERRKLAASRQVSAKGTKALKSGNMSEAVKQAREALRVHEQNAEAMLTLAEVFYKQGKFELTLSVTTSVQSIDPKVLTKVESSRAFNLKGFALLAMGKQTAATRAFRKAAEIDTKNATAWNNLGAQYIRTGNIKSAIDCFSYATRLDPRFYKAHLNLGSAYRATRDWPKAEASFGQALRLQPNY